MLLRVTDILLDNLIEDAMEWDEDDDWCKSKGKHKGVHLKKLVDMSNSCGVTFLIWEKRNAYTMPGVGLSFSPFFLLRLNRVITK